MWISNNTVNKVVLNQVRASNNILALGGRNVLVVGGTGGIGAAAALRFAQLGANVTIAGRNKKNGADIVDKMTAVSPNKDSARFHYIPVDITLLKDVKRFTSEYEQYNPEGINTLLVTSGGLNYGPKRNTEDGVEHNFAISYLGRFLVINRLLPLLLKAPGGGRAMSVLSAGRGGEIDLEDIEMKKEGSYSKAKSASVNSMANDFMVEELARQNKGNRMVATANNNIPLAGLVQPLIGWLCTSPEDYAEVVVHIATAPEFGPENSGIGLDQNGKPTKRIKFQDTPGAREKLWQYSVDVSGLNQE